MNKMKLNVNLNVNETPTSTVNQLAQNFRHHNEATANTVIGRKIEYENNLQKASEKQLTKYTKSTPNRFTGTTATTQINRESVNNTITSNDVSSLTTSTTPHDKYLRNIVGNAKNQFEKSTKTFTEHNEYNFRMNKSSPIKSVKLLNNLNVLKSRRFPVSVKNGDE